MRPPFPGMDPWLEHPALWPDVHNGLIGAIREDLTPRLAPKYFVGVERRIYPLGGDGSSLIGVADVALSVGEPAAPGPEALAVPAGVAVLEVAVPMIDEIGETYLEIREAGPAQLVTVIELLSPANKVHTEGRRSYALKRQRIFESDASLVEFDLMRAGRPMPVAGGERAGGDYRILVSRGNRRPRATLYTFGLRQPIPSVPIPLLPGDAEPALDLGAVLHAFYGRARYDLRLDYKKPPEPPLREADADWAAAIAATR